MKREKKNSFLIIHCKDLTKGKINIDNEKLK